ncbi:DUF3806 domain-containing protein [Agaribacterium haliotis]|uniref:DUF3806 domain-containing protein n=1 Tax=Agaribacterium haliotis TaxID=2013869 RepID=UPI00130429D3|nr:DUF3806 domain-containing protein [Agaribacterium haliotis]
MAQAQITFGPQLEAPSDKPQIRDLNFMNEQFLERQRSLADDLVRAKLGRQLRKTRNDLYLIQQMINRGHLADADTQTLQAFGAAMGDVYAHENRSLHWQVYEDELGASHAVCVDNSEHCIFPMTLLSRRMEAGLNPDPVKIYDTVLASIKPYMPRLPYSRDQ